MATPAAASCEVSSSPISLSTSSFIPMREQDGTFWDPSQLPDFLAPHHTGFVQGCLTFRVQPREGNFPAPLLPVSVALWESDHSTEAEVSLHPHCSRAPGSRVALDGNCNQMSSE